MNIRERQADRLIDPDNGFKIVFRSGIGRFVYSLVAVPADRYFRMEYLRWSAEVELGLEPIDSRSSLDWLVSGRFDSNTFADLGLPVAAARRPGEYEGKAEGEDGPLITAENIERARKFGELSGIGFSQRAGTQLYRAELLLPPKMVAGFFGKIWLPDVPHTGEPFQSPPIKVGNQLGEERVLPQKTPARKGSDLARLIVFNE